MKKKSTTSQSGFLGPRLLAAVLLCAGVGCLVMAGTSPATAGKAASLHNEAPANASQRALSFAERVAYQRAIEDVYWRHRIWPKENSDPKPSLDAVITQAQLEKKVADYLRSSQELDDYWQQPITAEQLQAEMERMAQHTKQPEVLRELFEALGNDPFVIAECLARPVLAERLLAHLAGEQAKQSSLTREQIVAAPGNYSLPAISDEATGCTDDTWTATSTTNAPIRRTGHTAVWTGSEMIVWGGDSQATGNTGGRYNPSTNNWTPTSATNAPSARGFHTAVWTGSEMIIWGGYYLDNWGNPQPLNTGGRYDPSTDSWRATSTSNAPSARSDHTAVWTGSEMIVWGGWNGANYFNTGGRYDPSTDSWRATSTSNAPTARRSHTAVWTGSEMIVWGGYDGGRLNTGRRYDPGTDSWRATSTTNAPTARAHHTAVWTGSGMIVWGGAGIDSQTVNTGGRYCASQLPPQFPPQLGNISTRAFVQTGDDVMIGGFIVQGTEPKRVIIRAIGPELTQYGVPNAMGNPTLELHNSTGALIASNDNWRTTIIGGIITTNQVGEITASGLAPGDGRESAIIGELPAGNYTAVVRGVNDFTGVALVEAYDLSPETNSILGNISTRAFVQTGDDVMIGGFVVRGIEPTRVIVRAIGPELTGYGVPNALDNPTLELHDGNGALIASNDDWQTTIIGGIITTDQVAAIRASGHAPSDPRESAIIADLPAGNYTAIVRGVNETTGVALVEVYDLE